MNHLPSTSVSPGLHFCPDLPQWLSCLIYLGASSEPASMPGLRFNHMPEWIICKTATAPCHQSIIWTCRVSAAGPLTTEAEVAWLMSELALAF